MSLLEILRALRTRWIVVLLAVLAGTGAGAAWSWHQPQRYVATTQFFVSMTLGESDGSQLAQGGTFTQERVKSYAEIITSPLVLDAVRDRLSSDLTSQELADRIEVSSPLDTVLMDIRVTDTSKRRAANVATALGEEFPPFVNRLELPAGGTSSPVKVSVTGPATVLDAPISPRWAVNLLIGLLLGVVAGVGYAVVRQRTDRTIRSKEQAAGAAGVATLGVVPDDPRDRPLITGDRATPRTEAFRQLRTNMRFLSVDRKLTSIVVTSALPGEGKTAVAANLAIALAQAGQSVVLIDGDMRRPRVADAFGISGGVGLSTVLLGDVGIRDARHQWREDLPLYLLPTGPLPPNPSELLATDQLRQLLDACGDAGMMVIFDSPPLLPVTDAAVLAGETDGAIIVTQIGRTRTDQLAGAAEAVRAAGGTVLGVVANRVRRTRRETSAYASYSGALVPRQTRST
jgi:capsular exopolysaccharide synthesis family protein